MVPIFTPRQVFQLAEGKESAPSNVSQVEVDSIGPQVISIDYNYPDNYDAITGRIGTGLLTFSLELSETLTRAPYFAIVPEGSSPIVVNLMRDAQNQKVYTGRFNISSDTPSGMAYLLFSGFDSSGNRGSEFLTSAQIEIDAQGPSLVNLQVSPEYIIDNNANTSGEYATVSLGLTLSEKVGSLSGPMIIPLLNNEQIFGFSDGISLTVKEDSNELVWEGSFVLPSGAGIDERGENTVDQLSFSFIGVDELNNSGTEIVKPILSQVYQGSLPPAAVPPNFTATALPAGKVTLTWGLVPGASQYKIQRKLQSETLFTELTVVEFNATSFNDGEGISTLNGTYEYVISSLREGQGVTVESALSQPVEITAISNKPNTPEGLQVSMSSQGVIATWNNVAGNGMRYNLYQVEAQDQISLTSNNLRLSGLEETQGVDGNVNRFESYYVVTAIDAIGNESLPSPVVVAQTDVIPVTQMTLMRNADDKPVVKWQYPNIDISGFNIYRDINGNSTKLNDSVLRGLWKNPQKCRI